MFEGTSNSLAISANYNLNFSNCLKVEIWFRNTIKVSSKSIFKVEKFRPFKLFECTGSKETNLLVLVGLVAMVTL